MRCLALLALIQCSGNTIPGPQPGCTQANCEALINACRVDLVGSPAANCNNVAPAPANFNFAAYCVDACNAQRGAGVTVQCIANKADECRDAGLQTANVIASCENLDAGAFAEQMCDDRCVADRKTCDDKCSGGRPCANCRNAGMPDCASVCPDAGYQDCTDCSAKCGLTYVACSAACPRG